MCHQDAGLYQIDLLGGSKNRVTEREHWTKKKGLFALDTKLLSGENHPPSLKRTRRSCAGRYGPPLLWLSSYEDFVWRLLQRGITVKESRGRLSYLIPDRAKHITAQSLGDGFDRAAVGTALDRNAAHPRRDTPAKKAFSKPM